MKGLRLLIITVLAVWLEISFFGSWRPFGIIPNLFLIVILAASTSLNRSSDALAMAIGGGILLDLASGVDFGLRTGFFIFVALLVIIIKRTGAEFDRLSMRMAAVISATVLYDLAVIASLVVARTSFSWSAVAQRIGVEVVLNVILAMVLQWPLRWLLVSQASSSVPVIAQGR